MMPRFAAVLVTTAPTILLSVPPAIALDIVAADDDDDSSVAEVCADVPRVLFQRSEEIRLPQSPAYTVKDQILLQTRRFSSVRTLPLEDAVEGIRTASAEGLRSPALFLSDMPDAHRRLLDRSFAALVERPRALRRAVTAGMPATAFSTHNQTVVQGNQTLTIGTIVDFASIVGGLEDYYGQAAAAFELWWLLVPVGLLALYIVYYIYRSGSQHDEDDDDDDWDLISEDAVAMVCGKRCAKGWCCCTFLALVNQCPTSLYLLGFLAGGFWVLWTYQVIQPVLQQALVYVYLALAIICIASLVIMRIFSTLRKAANAVFKVIHDKFDSLDEAFQSVQDGLDTVLDSLNPFDDDSDDSDEPPPPPGREKLNVRRDAFLREAQLDPPPFDWSCGMVPPAPPDVVFRKGDRVKCRDGRGSRWYFGTVASEVELLVKAERKRSEKPFDELSVLIDGWNKPRSEFVEVKKVKIGEPGFKERPMAKAKAKIKKSRAEATSEMRFGQ